MDIQTKGDEMKILLLLVAVLLSGCTRETPPSHEMTENAINTITAIQQSLPEECKTEANQLMFRVAEREVRGIEKQCDIEKAKIERQVIKWRLISFAMALVIIAYIAKRFVR